MENFTQIFFLAIEITLLITFLLLTYPNKNENNNTFTISNPNSPTYKSLRPKANPRKRPNQPSLFIRRKI